MINALNLRRAFGPFFFILSHTLFPKVPDCITQHLAQYKRPLTVIELCSGSACFSDEIARKYHAHCVVVIVDSKQARKKLKALERAQADRMVLLQPAVWHHEWISQLGRCEHFDLVIVHDGVPVSTLCHELIALGEHVYIEQAVPEQAAPRGRFLYYQHEKQYLTRVRFNATDDMKKKYKIISSFTEKKLQKETGECSTWVPGINLVTFFSLHGLYPTDSMLVKEIEKYRSSNHNDLVASNMIVQGSHLALIDFHDKRRSGKVPVYMKGLQKLISRWRSFEDPQEALYEYQRYLNKYIKD